MAKNGGAMHETLRDSGPKRTATDKSFGRVFAAVFAIIALFQFFADRFEWAIGLAALSIAFVIVSHVRPSLLSPLNRLWTRLGLLLHRVVNPIVLGMIFFVVCTPMGLVMRLFGFDPLRTKLDESAESYWIVRDPAGPEPETMKNQF